MRDLVISILVHPRLARSKCYDDDELNDPISDILVLRAIRPNGKYLPPASSFTGRVPAMFCMSAAHFPKRGLVRRMFTQIRTSLRRFEKLFIAYSAFLETLADRPPVNRHFVASKHTVNIGTESAAFLDALYGLRDAVHAVAYRMLFAGTGNFQTRKFKPRSSSTGNRRSRDWSTAPCSMRMLATGRLRAMSTYRALLPLTTCEPAIRLQAMAPFSKRRQAPLDRFCGPSIRFPTIWQNCGRSNGGPLSAFRSAKSR